jgi:hypothetical protein
MILSLTLSGLFDDMRVILITLMVTGGLIVIQPAFSRAKIIALWSDFKAFEARVAERTDGKAILALGGESSAESFEDLLRNLWELRGCTAVPYLGVAVSAVSAVALVLDSRRKKNVEPITGAKAG